jgi:hypothetical protein
MLALLQQAGSQVPASLQIAVAVLAALQSIAIIAGIIAAYYKFVKEKPHASRIQPAVSGTAEVHDGIIYIRAKVSAQNNGQVEVDLDVELTALEILSRKVGGEGWEYRCIASIFEQHEWVRPGEEIEDQIWVEIPYDGEIGIKLDLFVAESEDVVGPATEIVSLFTNKRGISSDDG